MILRRILLLMMCAMPVLADSGTGDPFLSTGRQPDPTAKTLSEIRAADKRRIPLEVMLKTSDRYPVAGPVEVTVLITNLFDAPLTMNNRMLVNHPRLEGEIAFRITGPNGKRIEFQRLVTPLSIRDQDFVVLRRGQSMQRTVDLSDLYDMSRKGTYKIQACYHNEVDHLGGQHPWKGALWSDPVEVQLQ